MPAACNNNPDLIGKRFDRLKIIGFESKKGIWFWICECDCGKTKVVRPSDVRYGRIKSCGCLHADIMREMISKGRDEYPEIYSKWCNVKSRCYNPNSDDYKYYGERGISFYWKDDYESFLKWALDTGWEPGLTLERKNVNGNYCPENCTWATHKEQMRNVRRNRTVEYNGEKMCMSEACELAGISSATVRSRIDTLGWDFDKAISTPSRYSKDRESSISVSYNGKPMNLSDACKEANVKYTTIYMRMRTGMTFEEALAKKSYSRA